MKTYTDTQQKIIQLLERLFGHGVAGRYRDLCKLIQRHEDFESPLPIIGHTLREIESIVRKHLVSLPEISQLIPPKSGNDRNSHEAEIKAILIWSGILDDSDSGRFWIGLIKSEYRLHDIAHKRSTWQPLVLHEEFISQVLNNFNELILTLLQSIERKFHQQITFIDSIAVKPPTDELVKGLHNKAFSAILQRRLLTKIKGDGWICALEKIGMFSPDKVPRELLSERSPSWPAGVFLAERAEKTTDEKERAAIAAIISGHITENLPVEAKRCFLMALKYLPPDASLANKKYIEAWLTIEKPAPFMIYNFVDLIPKWANNGNTGEAFDLFDLLFDVEEDQERHSKVASNFRDDDYGYHIKRVSASLIKCSPIDAINHSISLLTRMLQAKGLLQTETFISNMHLFVPSIEDGKGSAYQDLFSVVAFVRDAGLECIRIGPKELDAAISIVSQLPAALSNRMVMFFLSKIERPDTKIVYDLLSSEELMDSYAAKPEYVALAKAHFRKLSIRQRCQILANLRPSKAIIGKWRDNVKKREGRDATSQEQTDFIERRSSDRAVGWEAVLPKPCQKYINNLRQKHGEPRRRTHRSLSTPDSPKNKEQLIELADVDLIAFLKAEDSIETPFQSPNALGNELYQAVIENPARFLSTFDGIYSVHPTYIRHFINGYKQALLLGKGFDLSRLIDLCFFVAKQKDDPNGDEDPFGKDVGWRSSKFSVLSFVKEALKKKEVQLSKETVNRFLELIYVLTDDLDPPPGAEENRDSSLYEIAFNSVRGEALEILIRSPIYLALRKAKGDEEVHYKDAQALIPEPYWKILFGHLDKSNDSSLPIHSIYGAHFSALMELNAAAAIEMKPFIFPVEPFLEGYYNAALETFVEHCNPSKKIFDLCKCEFLKFLSRDFPEGSHNNELLQQFAPKLAHLLVNGSLQDGDEILVLFLKKSTDEVRGDVFQYIGRILADPSNQFSEEEIERVKRYVEARVSAAEAGGSGKAYGRELGEFSYLLSSTYLEPEWCASTTRRIQTLSVVLKRDFLLIEWIQKILDQHPREVLLILRGHIQGDSEEVRWFPLAHQKEIQDILERSKALEKKELSDLANEIISLLSVKGHEGFI